MSLYKRLLTQLDGKMGPALRVSYKDVGEGREQGGGSFAPEKAPLSVACRDAGQGREQEAISFARCSFGTTKPRASRLDWRFFRGNINNCVV